VDSEHLLDALVSLADSRGGRLSAFGCRRSASNHSGGLRGYQRSIFLV